MKIMKKISYLFILLLSVLSFVACSTRKNEDDNGGNQNNSNDKIYVNDYQTISKVGYSAEILGTVKRKIPSEGNEGLAKYPEYGTTLNNLTEEEKMAIYEESYYLTPIGLSKATNDNVLSGDYGAFNRIDKDGYLYLNNEKALDASGKPRKLYKHTASQNMYYGEVSDDEQAVVKKITMAPKSYTKGYGITGLYVPAGEVIKVEMSGEDMRNTDGITFHIGQALFNGQSNNIPLSRDFCRMPNILSSYNFNIDLSDYNEETDTYTGYIGSYLGGPLYIRNETSEFTVTISGGLTYSHFILGYTTEEDFIENSKSNINYFDLEVWDSGVLHSGPKNYASEFSYNDLYNVAVLWEKIAMISTQVENQGIVFCYDPFITAGAACAFPGRGSVTCPSGWMSGSLNYDSFIESGSWGNIHEYNHNFQKYYINYWGMGDATEVTNNVLNLVAYATCTNISAKRQLGTLDEGLSDWNKFTNPSWALRDITEGTFNNGQKGLSVYANYFYSFGQEIMLDAINKSTTGSVDDWFKATMNASGYDMTYYYKDLVGLDVSTEVLDDAATRNYSMFVPVASIYQTGRSYYKDGKKMYCKTSTPYRIEYNNDFEIDLGRYTIENGEYKSGSIVLPEGFSYKIKSVSKPTNGKITKVSDTIYKYTPGDNRYSEEIYVTLEITKNDGAFKVKDVELVLEFENSQEMDKYSLDRTTYTYENQTTYLNAKEAYENNYEGYVSKETTSNVNPTQDCSAEVWFSSKPNAKQVIELSGKYYIEEAGKYRIALRGRFSCALYASKDGKTYTLAGEYHNYDSDKNISWFSLKDGTYTDYELEASSWLYFKAVLKCWDTGGYNSFVGVGLGKFDSNGNVTINKVNAYNNDYILIDKFVADYYFEKDYKYSYQDNIDYKGLGTVIKDENYSAWTPAQHILSNLLDGDKNTYIHTNYDASPDKPLILTIDCGKEVSVNRLTLYTQPRSDYHCPVSFKIEGSIDNDNWFTLGEYNDLTVKDYSVKADFDETTIRYYRISFTKSSYRYIIISEAELSRVFEINDGKHISLDSNDVTMKGSWESVSSLSSFGHYYSGKKGSTVEFEFTGNQFGILSNNLKAEQFEVYIDGKKINSIDLKNDKGIVMSYISEELKSGKHTVKIKCLSNCNIDSLVYW